MGSEPISLWGNIDATSFKTDAGAKHQEKYVAVLASDFLALQRRAEEAEATASGYRAILKGISGALIDAGVAVGPWTEFPEKIRSLSPSAAAPTNLEPFDSAASVRGGVNRRVADQAGSHPAPHASSSGVGGERPGVTPGAAAHDAATSPATPTPASGGRCPRCHSERRDFVRIVNGCIGTDHHIWHDEPADAGRE